MLRDRNLIPLSHQHQHALALYVQIERGLQSGQPDPTTPARTKTVRAGDPAQHWQQEIARLFASGVRYHFEAEEKVLFPFAQRAPSLRDLVDELRIEHVSRRRIRRRRRRGTPHRARLQRRQPSQHVRKEEQQLFEGMQELFSAEELARAGAELNSCLLTDGHPRGKLRAAKIVFSRQKNRTRN